MRHTLDDFDDATTIPRATPRLRYVPAPDLDDLAEAEWGPESTLELDRTRDITPPRRAS